MQPTQEAGKMSALQGEGLVLCESVVLQDCKHWRRAQTTALPAKMDKTHILEM